MTGYTFQKGGTLPFSFLPPCLLLREEPIVEGVHHQEKQTGSKHQTKEKGGGEPINHEMGFHDRITA